MINIRTMKNKINHYRNMNKGKRRVKQIGMEGSYDFDSEEEEEEEGEQEETEQIAEHEEQEQEDETHDWRRGRFTPAQEEELAQWFCDNPCFYDQSQRLHFNRAKRDKMMQDKARSMGLNGEYLLRLQHLKKIIEQYYNLQSCHYMF